MTPREVFGLVIRTFGLIGLLSLPVVLFQAVLIGTAASFFFSFLMSAVTGFLLRGAPVLVEFCYPSSRESRWQEDHARFTPGAERVI